MTLGPTWILDFDASHHMTNTLQLFTSLDPFSTSQNVVGNSSQLLVMSSSFVALVRGSLQDVLCVPDISMNLLSIYQIFHSVSSKIVEFLPHYVVIQDLYDFEMIVGTGSVDSTSHLYRFDGFEYSDDIGSCHIAHADSVNKLWHEHLGHVNYRYLQQMSTHALVLGLPQISYTNGVCQGCALGKQHRDSFPHGWATRALAPLELIHSDLISFSTPFSSARYVLIFIDDFSRCTWVYILKYKSGVFDSFQIFKTFLEKQSGLLVKCICTDNEGNM